VFSATSAVSEQYRYCQLDLLLLCRDCRVEVTCVIDPATQLGSHIMPWQKLTDDNFTSSSLARLSTRRREAFPVKIPDACQRVSPSQAILTLPSTRRESDWAQEGRKLIMGGVVYSSNTTGSASASASNSPADSAGVLRVA